MAVTSTTLNLLLYSNNDKTLMNILWWACTFKDLLSIPINITINYIPYNCYAED